MDFNNAQIKMMQSESYVKFIAEERTGARGTCTEPPSKADPDALQLLCWLSQLRICRASPTVLIQFLWKIGECAIQYEKNNKKDSQIYIIRIIVKNSLKIDNLQYKNDEK